MFDWSSIFKKKPEVQKMSTGGAIQGAGTGAAAGASFGPWGAGIGAGLGLVSGMMGGESGEANGASSQWSRNQQERLDDMFAGAANEYGGAAGAAPGLRDYRAKFGAQLGNQALGQGPSIADAQLKMAMDRNLAQQIGAAKSNRAVNPALAGRQVANMAAQAQQQTAAQSAVNKLQERQAAGTQFANWNQQLAQNAGMTQPSSYSQTAANQASQYDQTRRDSLNAGMINGVASGLQAFSSGNKPPSGPFVANEQQSNAGLSKGGKIPGKPEVSGDSEQNDKVPALLSPGEIVVPRTVVAKGHKAAASFVKDVLAKDKMPEVSGKMWEGSETIKVPKKKEEPGFFASMFGSSDEEKKKIGQGLKDRLPKDKTKSFTDSYNNPTGWSEGGLVKSNSFINALYNDKEEQKKSSMHGANPAQSGESTLENTDNYAEGGMVGPGQMTVKETEAKKQKERIKLLGPGALTAEEAKRLGYADGGLVGPGSLTEKEKLQQLMHSSTPGSITEAERAKQLVKKVGPGALSIAEKKRLGFAKGGMVDCYSEGGEVSAGFGAILAAQAHLNKRLSEIERKYGKKD